MKTYLICSALYMNDTATILAIDTEELEQYTYPTEATLKDYFIDAHEIHSIEIKGEVTINGFLNDLFPETITLFSDR